MISPETAFEQILLSIKPILTKNGFSEIEKKNHPEAFGSCYITFSDGKEFIRLVWDGKESWFVIESMPADSITSSWVDILLQYFKPNTDDSNVIEEIEKDIKAALTNYLGSEFL